MVVCSTWEECSLLITCQSFKEFLSHLVVVGFGELLPVQKFPMSVSWFDCWDLMKFSSKNDIVLVVVEIMVIILSQCLIESRFYRSGFLSL